MNLKTLSKMPNHKMGIVRFPLLKGSWFAPPERVVMVWGGEGGLRRLIGTEW